MRTNPVVSLLARLAAVCLAAASTTSLAAISAQPQIAADSPAALGHIDMNADGVVNAGDLVLLLQAIQSQ